MFGLTACSSTRTLELRTDPPGAKIYLNGLDSGTSPRLITFDFGTYRYNVVQLVSPGYKVNWNVYALENLPEDEYMTITLSR